MKVVEAQQLGNIKTNKMFRWSSLTVNQAEISQSKEVVIVPVAVSSVERMVIWPVSALTPTEETLVETEGAPKRKVASTVVKMVIWHANVLTLRMTGDNPKSATSAMRRVTCPETVPIRKIVEATSDNALRIILHFG